jgi:predicted RNA binding protein YcfA (HicA-like mRNA interferase family)
MKAVAGREMGRALERKGWRLSGSRGSHHKYVDSDGAHIVVPIHPGKDLSPGVQRKIMRDAGLTDADL